jgi:Flp pilus assembly pilin Flp
MDINLRQLWKHDDGQDLIEYSLLMALIALVTVGLIHAKLTGIWSPHSPSPKTMAS